MPRQPYPGEYKFYIVGDEARQGKQRADTRMRIAKLRQRQRQKKYSDNVNKQRVTRQASERYKFHKPTKYDEFY